MRITIIIKLLSVLLPFTFARSWTTNDGCPEAIKTTVNGASCRYATELYPCSSEPEFDTMDAVHTALSSCPNITSLDLRVSISGCDSGPERWDFPLNPLGGDKYANLTTLRLEGYEFGRPPHIDGARYEDFPTTWLRSISDAIKPAQAEDKVMPNPTSNNKTHLDLWLAAMPLGLVEDLKLDTYDITHELVAKLPPHLTSLRTLESNHAHFITALSNNTLTSLTYIGAAQPPDLPAILAHQGKSLASLAFRRPEDAHAPFLADFDMADLSAMARHLTHLAVNVPRNGTWPLDMLRVVASLPRLEDVDVYMSIASECQQRRDWEGCVGEARFQRPFVSRDGAEDMFAYMRLAKKGLALKRVVFWAGDWAGVSDGPLRFPGWLEGKRVKVVCGVEGAGGKGDEGRCVVEEGGGYWRREGSRLE